jgi:hypothetical protein
LAAECTAATAITAITAVGTGTKAEPPSKGRNSVSSTIVIASAAVAAVAAIAIA